MKEGGGGSGGEEGEGKNCFAWLQSKRAEEDSVFFFPLLLRVRLAAAVTDGLCMRARRRGGARVFMRPRVLSQAPSVSVSRGRGEDVGEGPRGS